VDHSRDPGSDSRAALRRSKKRQPRFFGRARRWLRPPRTLRPTRAGWAFFAITFGIGFAALNTGNNLLYMVLALLLAFLVLSGLLSEAALRGIRVRRRLPRELFAERDGRVVLDVTNDQSRASAYAVVVEDRIGSPGVGDQAAGRCFALQIGPGETQTRAYRLRPEQRGPLCFRGFVVSTRFPFGLFSKALVLDAEESTLVYPAIDPVALPDARGMRRRRGETTAPDVAGHGATVSGLREHTPGDSRRRIHWRASLRSGILLVRDLEAERDADVEVRLDTRGVRGGNRFEGRVRRAASEVVALLEAGRRVALRTGIDHFAPGAGRAHRARLLRHLAEIQPDARSAETP
jgi:uncharacterized protein (DUF58 family)